MMRVMWMGSSRKSKDGYPVMNEVRVKEADRESDA